MQLERLPIILALFLVGLAEAPAAELPAPNALTAREQANGWVLLFDGKSTAGWHAFREPAIGPQWQVIDGALTLTAGGGGDLLTDDLYGDFELALEWQISRHGNSGIFYRVLDDGPYVFVNGPEYQLLDNRDAVEPPKEQAAALFDLLPPLADETRPLGQFNATRIKVEQGHVEHWLNGIKVVDYQMDSPDFARRVAAGKYGIDGGLGRWTQKFSKVRRGSIGLQDHGHVIAFRSIKIRALN